MFLFLLFFILRKNYQNNYNRKVTEEDGKSVIRIILSEEVTFLNKGSIIQTLQNLPEGSKVIIDGQKCNNINYDVLEAITEFKNFGAAEKNIDFSTVNIKEVAL